MIANLNITEKLNVPVEEAYKVLRANIQFCGFNKKVKTLAITSCNPGEGKTTTAVNLSISMARAGMKVLLIDADLRKPMVMKRLGYNNEVGLSNLIAGYSTPEETITRTNTENFFYIACGPKPPNPAELISSSAFKEFLNQMESLYDIIIIDTPPLGAVIDCAVVSAQVDGTLIVIESNEVEYQQVLRVKEQLEKVGAGILGVVLNKIRKHQYKEYCNNYNYYGTDRKMKKTWFKEYKKSGKVCI